MEIFLKTCLGLAAFHNNKKIHRDLKPESIFMFDEITPKTGDVRLSRNLASESNASSFGVTILYFPPETLNNKRYYKEKSDMEKVNNYREMEENIKVTGKMISKI